MQFIKYYMQKENYSPTVEQRHLLERVVAVQKMMEGVSQENTKEGSLDEIL